MHTDSIIDHSRGRRSTLISLLAMLLGALTLLPFTVAPAWASQGGYTMVRNSRDGLCLDAADGAMNPSAPVGARYCTDALSQQWKFVRLTSGWYQIVVLNTGMCLNVGNASHQDGEQIVQYPCVTDPNNPWRIYGANEQWRLQHVGGGYYQIIARHSGKCLDKSGWNVVQWQCHNVSWQHWTW